VGIFGHYASLTLRLPEPLAGRTVWVQDLAGETAVDATAAVQMDDRRLVLSGAWIDQAGTVAASPGDISGPGLVLALKE
jgi:hypothetical protein